MLHVGGRALTALDTRVHKGGRERHEGDDPKSDDGHDDDPKSDDGYDDGPKSDGPKSDDPKRDDSKSDDGHSDDATDEDEGGLGATGGRPDRRSRCCRGPAMARAQEPSQPAMVCAIACGCDRGLRARPTGCPAPPLLNKDCNTVMKVFVRTTRAPGIPTPPTVGTYRVVWVVCNVGSKTRSTMDPSTRGW